MPSPTLRSIELIEFAWVKRSNTRGRRSADIPTPVSRTRKVTVLFSSPAESQIRPPGSVYFAALLSRLMSICVSRASSPVIRMECAGSVTSRVWLN